MVLDPPGPLGDYPGCGQFPIEIAPAETFRRLEPVHQLSGGPADLIAVTTAQPVRAIRYNMFGFFQQCIDVYIDLARVSVDTSGNVTTHPIDDDNVKPGDFDQDGVLAADAARIMMNILYGGRLVTFELLLQICNLARQVCKWTDACGKGLHRLISYDYHTLDHSRASFVRYGLVLCHPVLFPDADFAGDIVGAESASCLYLINVGPNAFAPVTASCTKQTCVSHPSAGSEIAAVEQGVRTEGLQALAYFEFVVDLLSGANGAKKVSETQAKPAGQRIEHSALGFGAGDARTTDVGPAHAP